MKLLLASVIGVAPAAGLAPAITADTVTRVGYNRKADRSKMTQTDPFSFVSHSGGPAVRSLIATFHYH